MRLNALMVITIIMFDSFRITIADLIAPELATERRALERAANTDHLTGLASRRAFDLALPGAERDPQIAILVFDANNFGKVNKINGHQAGDQLLRSMAQAIRACADRFDLGARCFRTGGDEFAILVPARLVDTLRADIEQAATYQVNSDLEVSLTGTYAGTYSAADALLQARKAKRKRCCNEVTNQTIRA